LAHINNKFHDNAAYNKNSIFFSPNLFSKDHKFTEIFSDKSGVILNNFTYLDKVYSYYKSVSEFHTTNSALIFHPGGYRKVLTVPGASKKVSYKSQEDFLTKTCLPLIKSGLKPIIKIHPLHARYHGVEDMKEIANDFENTYKIPQNTIDVTDEWYWKYAFNASFILTFGSSTIYELWAAGVKNTFVCNFLGKDRSIRFSYFKGIYLDTHEQYANFVKNEIYDKALNDEFTSKIIDAYAKLFDGNSIKTAIKYICK